MMYNGIKTEFLRSEQEKMDYVFSSLIGYALGCISPSYILSRAKNVDIRKSGTKNLGASNTFIHFGRFWGIFVMLFDILKAFFAVKICALLFPRTVYGGLAAGCAAVIGHNYPAFLKFKGGKGLASFAGLVLGISPMMFLSLLILSLTIALIINYGCVVALAASVLFPIIVGIHYGSPIPLLIALICSVSVFYKHSKNIGRIKRGEEIKLTHFIKRYVAKKSK